MRAVVAHQFQAVFVLGGDDFDGGVLLDEKGQILDHAVGLQRQGVFRQARADGGGDFCAGNRRLEIAPTSVGQIDCNHET